MFYGSSTFPADERPPIPYVPELDDPAWKPVYGEPKCYMKASADNKRTCFLTAGYASGFLSSCETIHFASECQALMAPK